MSLAAWAKTANASLTPALSKLAALPHVKHGVEPPPPLVVGNKASYEHAREAAGYKGHLSQEIAKAPIEKRSIEGVHTIQHSVNPDRVAQYLRNPQLTPKGARGTHGGPIDYPILVKVGGVTYAHDGHHRLVAGVLAGDTTATVRYVDLDSPGKKAR